MHEQLFEKIDKLALGLLEPAEHDELLRALENLPAEQAETAELRAQLQARLSQAPQDLESLRRVLNAWTVPSPDANAVDSAMLRVGSELDRRQREAETREAENRAARDSHSKPHKFRRHQAIWSKRRILFAAAAAIAAIVNLGIFFHLGNRKPEAMRAVVLYPPHIPVDARFAARVLLTDSPEGSDEPGAPVAEGTVRLTLRKQDARGETLLEKSFPVRTTDASGSADVSLSTAGLEPGPYRLIVESEKGDWRNRLERDVLLVRPYTVLVQTDRPAYRPGERIRMRAVVLHRPSLKPASGEPIRFELIRGDGGTAGSVAAVTGRFGIASAEIDAGAETVRVAARVGGSAGSAASEIPVFVGQFDLPKLRAEIEFEQTVLGSGEPAVGSVRVVDLAGKSVAGAEVELQFHSETVRRTERLRGTADDAGVFRFRQSVPAVVIPKEGADRVLVEVRVRRDAETARAGKWLTLCDEPVLVRVVPEGRRTVAGLENFLFVAAVSPDGKPVVGSVRVGESEVRLDEGGVARVGFVPTGRTGERVRVTVVPLDAPAVVRDVAVRPAADNSSGILLRPARSLIRAGETLTVDAVAGFKTGSLFVDVFHGESFLLSSHVVAIDKGAGRLELDVPVEIAGTLVLRAYRLIDGKVQGLDRRLVVVKPARSVSLSAVWSKPAYAAGDTAELSIEARRPDGQPVESALGVSVFDLALRDVYLDRPGSLRRLLLPERAGAKAGAHGSGAARLISDDTDRDDLFRRAVLAETEQLWADDQPVLVERKFADLLRGDSRELRRYEVESHRRRYMGGLLAGAFVSVLALFIVVGRSIPAGRPAPALVLLVAACGVGGLFLAVGTRVPEQPRELIEPHPARFTDAGVVHKNDGLETGSGRTAQMPDADITLLWLPELITDASGRTSIRMPARSTVSGAPWRVSLSAITEDGLLGTIETDLPR